MAKAKSTVFFCKSCGFESSKWLGQCPGCREWNTFTEAPAAKASKGSGQGGRGLGAAAISGGSSEAVRLEEIDMTHQPRMDTGSAELNRVLGGGIVPGSLILVGGDPGIGKSTLLLQTCRQLAASGRKVLYISGEESLAQIRMRADRIGHFTGDLTFYCETDLDIIEEKLNIWKPEVVVIDSIQTMYREEVAAVPGSVSQVRESTSVLLRLAKGLGIAIFIVGHVTKEGTVAGPRILEHMVDT
ncbi:MAG: AAA family ATPase, partial [Lachnospiraceae bacterium]|nr:AAA family ATPase [Lachnospiraceae bacterium]